MHNLSNSHICTVTLLNSSVNHLSHHGTVLRATYLDCVQLFATQLYMSKILLNIFIKLKPPMLASNWTRHIKRSKNARGIINHSQLSKIKSNYSSKPSAFPVDNHTNSLISESDHYC